MTSINGSSVIVDKMTFVIQDYCSFKNFIIPSSPSINGNVNIVLPRVVDKDSNSFRIINFSMFKIILQSRYSEKIDDICNSFTVNNRTLVNVEFSDETNNFCICGSKKIEDSMVLQ